MKNIFLHMIKPDMIPIDFEFCSLENFDKIEDASIDNLIIQDMLDYIVDGLESDIVSSIHSKMSPGGLLHIQSIDLKQLGIAIAFEDVDISLVKKILYPYKKSIRNMKDAQNLFLANKFNIQNSKYVNVFEYYICLSKDE